MKTLFFSLAIMLAGTCVHAQALDNFTNCEMALYSACYDISSCGPGSTPSQPRAVAPANTSVTFSSGCSATEYAVYYLEYTACPGTTSGLFSATVPPWCPFVPVSSVINLGQTQCPGCDEVDVIEQPSGNVQAGNP